MYIEKAFFLVSSLLSNVYPGKSSENKKGAALQ